MITFATITSGAPAVSITEWLIVFTNILLTLVTLALVAQGAHDTNALVKIVAMLTGRGKDTGHKGKHER